MRGKAGCGVIENTHYRITPAYAGKRIKLRKRHSICGDYPRVCGEKLRIVEVGRVKEGSPPRMRGKVALHGELRDVGGITPAYAGKSVKQRIEACLSVGSPPRVRGKVPSSI